ncbi:nucleotidyltransferase domain-containing protein [Candidatus Woesearchaeota archaeon]|nr:nucleotidyltransferase domain-containing protein [Candidatus Woesearchaeota archaeon]
MNNSKIKFILNGILKDIQPDKNYEKDIFERLNSIIKKINKNQKHIKAILGGSGAKGTWLKTFDADTFVLFDYKKYKDKSNKLSDILEKILKKKFKSIIRLHGSRDYFQIKEGKFTFEIVPILKIKKAEQAKNITDVSPLHSNWVKKHGKLVDEIKLTKQFAQAQNVYGAESYIRGFSGYVCEILTVHYGSFLNLIKNSAKWKGKAVVDAAGYYRGKDVFKIVNTSKLMSPLIVIDPVQKDRNAAAALSEEKFSKFKEAAIKFLKNPSGEFFVRKDLKSSFEKLKSGMTMLITIKLTPLDGKIDVVGSKLIKIYGFLAQQLGRSQFNIIKSDWEWNKKSDAALYFLFDAKPLSNKVEIEGPPLKILNHVQHFKKQHKNTFEKSGKIYAVDKRKYTLPEDLLESLLKDPYVRERAKSAKIL